MRVLLISANTARTPYPVYPLGISIVAGVLRRAGHEVTLFDLLQHNGSEEALAEAVRTRPPGLVGISIRNIDNVNLLNEQRYIETVRRLVTRIRAGSRAVILLGGCGFSIMPGRILEAVGADYGIVGEGEELAVEFAARIARGERPAQRLFFAPPALRGRGIPSAAYDPDVMAFYLQNGNVASVQTKRGCPHACIYCTYPALEGSDLRPRDPRDVVDDIERLQRDHNARFLFFTDSVFNDREGLYLDILREMRRRNLNVPWTAFFRPDALDDATIELMKATGLQAVELGSDAASDTTLRGLGKDFLFDDILACSGRFIAHGVPVAHYFMFGCPGETPETVSEGVANVRKLATAVWMSTAWALRSR